MHTTSLKTPRPFPQIACEQSKQAPCLTCLLSYRSDRTGNTLYTHLLKASSNCLGGDWSEPCQIGINNRFTEKETEDECWMTCPELLGWQVRKWTSFFLPADHRRGLGSHLTARAQSTTERFHSRWRNLFGLPRRKGTAPWEGYLQRPGSRGQSRRQWCQEGGKGTWKQWIQRPARPRERPHHYPAAPSPAPSRRRRSAATAGRPPSWPRAPASGATSREQHRRVMWGASSGGMRTQ